MNIYKTVFKILRSNRGTLLLGVAITAFIIFAQSGAISTDHEAQPRKANITILSEDDSLITSELIDYLEEEQNVVKLADTSEKALDDALYFEEVAYILTIPASFSEELLQGNLPELVARTRPGTFSKVLVDTSINQFLNTYLLFQRNQPEVSPETILQQTRETLQTEKSYQLDSGYNQRVRKSVAARLVNLLAYGLFTAIFSAYGLVNVSFNRPVVRMRNNCSPMSRRKLSRKVGTANLLYSLILTIGFGAFVLYFSKIQDLQILGLFVVNILAFFFTMIAFSIMVTNLTNNIDTISGVSNIFILGSCFISGVFVPSEILPDIVNRIAAFTPSYWFIQNNQLIGESPSFGNDFYQSFGLNLFVLLAFSLAFLIVQFISTREKSLDVLNKSKRTAR